MARKLLLASLIILCGALFALWDVLAPMPAQDTSAQNIPALNEPNIKTLTLPLKTFTFTTLDGQKKHSEILKGKIVVLNFWASWCTPCLVEFPDLITLTAAYPDDVIFLAISVDENSQNAEKFLRKFPAQDNRIIGHDPEKTIAHDLFQTTLFPETYILDRNGTIRRHIIGVTNWKSPALRADLEALIAEQP